MSRAALQKQESIRQNLTVDGSSSGSSMPIMPTLSQPSYSYPGYYDASGYQLQTAPMLNMVQPTAPTLSMIPPPPPNYVGGAPLPPMQQFNPIRIDEEEAEEDISQKKNVLPIHGNATTFNINNLLHQNIMESDYFRALYQLRTYHEVIDEIHISVKHVEPWQAGTNRAPSSAFCLLLKFLLMRLTLKQMKGLLDTGDSAYVRAIGLLYLRYSCPPKELYKWYEPYLEDEEEFCPSADPNLKFTIGKYCIKLLTDMQYFGTMLPRIPVLIERRIKVMLLLLEERKKRRRANMRYQDRGVFRSGQLVKAIYQDEENEPAWYEAKIDLVDDEERFKYWVTFTEYGNSEMVDLGDLQVPDEVVEEEREREKERKRKKTS
mmetsp:Transcript_21221/g.21342  ORF Transcript_21221/g.21342 Transcript_21221/m.21342 type:complete len:376 (+) Transcript_21221:164-1291(+)